MVYKTKTDKMKMKQYSSFDEIDQDLKILQLKKQIALIEAKNHTQEIKENIKHGKFLVNIASKTWRIAGSKKGKILGIVSSFVIKRILKKGIKKKH